MIGLDDTWTYAPQNIIIRYMISNDRDTISTVIYRSSDQSLRSFKMESANFSPYKCIADDLRSLCRRKFSEDALSMISQCVTDRTGISFSVDVMLRLTRCAARNRIRDWRSYLDYVVLTGTNILGLMDGRIFTSMTPVLTYLSMDWHDV